MSYIKVYRFEDAPEDLKKLSNNGGDEDWLAVVPPDMKDDYIGWLESGSSFGCFDVEEHILDTGEKVMIECHG